MRGESWLVSIGNSGTRVRIQNPRGIFSGGFVIDEETGERVLRMTESEPMVRDLWMCSLKPGPTGALKGRLEYYPPESNRPIKKGTCSAQLAPRGVNWKWPITPSSGEDWIVTTPKGAWRLGMIGGNQSHWSGKAGPEGNSYNRTLPFEVYIGNKEVEVGVGLMDFTAVWCIIKPGGAQGNLFKGVAEHGPTHGKGPVTKTPCTVRLNF
ncbi:hypothetical protein DEDE109153_01150 [Deinococcus deserti]